MKPTPGKYWTMKPKYQIEVLIPVSTANAKIITKHINSKTRLQGGEQQRNSQSNLEILKWNGTETYK